MEEKQGEGGKEYDKRESRERAEEFPQATHQLTWLERRNIDREQRIPSVRYRLRERQKDQRNERDLQQNQSYGY